MSRTINLCALLFCVSVFSTTLLAQGLTGSVNEAGNVVLSGEDIALLGIDLQSDGGFLVPVSGNTPAPFDLFVRNTNFQIIYGTLGRPVNVDGDLVLSARYSNGQNFEGDLTGEWGGPELDGPILFQVMNDGEDPMNGVDPDPTDPVDGGDVDPTDPVDPVIDDMVDNMDGDDDAPTSGGGGTNPIDEMLPEPGSASMLLMAGVALTLLRRRRR